ncbi:hypothetical protein D3C71_1769120 [compost metagenome]
MAICAKSLAAFAAYPAGITPVVALDSPNAPSIRASTPAAIVGAPRLSRCCSSNAATTNSVTIPSSCAITLL